jgi:multiple sugar transport system permease protein
MAMPKRFLCLIILLASPSALAGWIEDKPDGQTVIHVSIYSFLDPRQTDAYTRSEIAGINEFRHRFPEIFAARYREKYLADSKRYGKHNWENVSVELHSFRGINVEGIENDTMAIAGGIPPDVLYVNFRKSDHYIQNRFLYPLDRSEDGYLVSMTKEETDFRVHPKLWPILKRKGPDGNEHVWALPQGGALGMVLLYRKNLFDKRGVAYPNDQWTWDDLLRACRKLSDPGKGQYALVGGLGQSEAWYWFNYLWAAGGEVMVQDAETGEWKLVFDSRECARSLDFYTKLNTERWTDAEGKERRGYTLRDVNARDAWRRGEVAMCVDYVDGNLLTTINPELTGMSPTPLGPTGKRGSELNSKMMGLSSQIKSDVVRDAAWEFMRFYDSEEACRIKTRVLVEGGLGVFVNPSHLRRFGYPEIERLSPKGWSQIFETAISTGHPEPYGPNAGYVLQMATHPLRQVEELAMKGALPADESARLDVIQDLLRQGVKRGDEEMLGRVMPAERARRDRTAWGVLIVFLIIGVVSLYRTARSFTHRASVAAKSGSFRRRLFWAYVLLLPAMLTILVWQYVPLLRGSVMAFQDYRLQGGSTWVGVQNFGDLLYNSYWWQSVWNALRYSFLIMALTFLPPVLLSILLQEVPRGSLLFRIIFYLPAVLSGLVTVVLWKQFYEASENGILNMIVMRIPAIAYLLLGIVALMVATVFAKRLWIHGAKTGSLVFVLAGIAILLSFFAWAQPILFADGSSLAAFFSRLFATPREPYRWLADPATAMLACVIPMVWASIGPGCLVYLAALKGISDDFYEAADLDGADLIDKILFIVFPILRPLILINFIGVFIGSWYGAEANILTMTAGAGNTEVAGLHIFYKAFQGLQFGPATAMAWVLAFMLIGFTVYQLRIIGRLEFRTTGEKK